MCIVSNMSKFLPQLARVRNEVVFYVGLAVTLITEAVLVLAGIDFTSTETLLAAIPAFTAFVQRLGAYGPETVRAHYPDAQ